jgi:hypothetical protein
MALADLPVANCRQTRIQRGGQHRLTQMVLVLRTNRACSHARFEVSGSVAVPPRRATLVFMTYLLKVFQHDSSLKLAIRQ